MSDDVLREVLEDLNAEAIIVLGKDGKVYTMSRDPAAWLVEVSTLGGGVKRIQMKRDDK